MLILSRTTARWSLIVIDNAGSQHSALIAAAANLDVLSPHCHWALRITEAATTLFPLRMVEVSTTHIIFFTKNGGWAIIIAIDENGCWWDLIATENADWALIISAATASTSTTDVMATATALIQP